MISSILEKASGNHKYLGGVMKSYCTAMLVLWCSLTTKILFAEDVTTSGGTAGYTAVIGTARTLVFGPGYVALADDSAALLFNSAGITQVQQKTLQLSYVALFEDTAYQLGTFVLPIIISESDYLTVGVLGSQLASSNIIERDNTNALTGTTYSDKTVLYGVALSYARNENLMFGVTLKHMSRYFANDTASSVGADIGLLWLPFPILSLGMNVSDISTNLDWPTRTESIPMGITTGLGIKLDDPVRLNLSGGVTYKLGLPLMYGLGIEYEYNILGVCVGYDTENKLTGGLGINMKNWRLDYAILYHELSLSHRFTLSFGFGPERTEQMDDIRREIIRIRQIISQIKAYEQTADTNYVSGKKRDALNNYNKAIKQCKGINVENLKILHLTKEIAYVNEINVEIINRINELQNVIVKIDVQQKNGIDLFYNKNKYYEAKKCFEEVLKYEPENQAAAKSLEEVNEIITEIERLRQIAIPDFIPVNFMDTEKLCYRLTNYLDTSLKAQKSCVLTLIRDESLKVAVEKQIELNNGIYDRRTAQEIGNLVSAGMVAFGKISQENGLYVINIDMVDVKTGGSKIGIQETQKQNENNTDFIDRLSGRLAQEICTLTQTGGR